MHPYLTWLLVAGAVTFLLYGWDKSLSKRKGWRVPEKVFHALTLAGGFIGGWLGRYLFRHKTKKGYFLFILIASTVIHAAIIWWVWGRV